MLDPALTTMFFAVVAEIPAANEKDDEPVNVTVSAAGLSRVTLIESPYVFVPLSPNAKAAAAPESVTRIVSNTPSPAAVTVRIEPPFPVTFPLLAPDQVPVEETV